MIRVEYIDPYAIVLEGDRYGIINSDGEYVVPCIMDYIINMKDESTSSDLWRHFDCVAIINEDKCGFFTKSGVFVAPEYEAFTIDPFGRAIYVKTSDGYGILQAPEYEFKETPYQSCEWFEEEVYGEDEE